MLEGKRFFPETGTPIWKMARMSVVFAVWLPEPFTVATWMQKSFVVAVKGISKGRDRAWQPPIFPRLRGRVKLFPRIALWDCTRSTRDGPGRGCAASKG